MSTNKTLVYKSLEFNVNSSSRYLKLFTCSESFDLDCIVKTNNGYTNLKINITDKNFCKIENFSTNLVTWENFTKIIKKDNSYYIDFGSGIPAGSVSLKFNINYGNITIDSEGVSSISDGTPILELLSEKYTNTYRDSSRFKDNINIEKTTYTYELDVNGKTTVDNKGVVTVNTGRHEQSGYIETSDDSKNYDVKIFGTTVSKGLVVEKGLFSRQLTSSEDTILTNTKLNDDSTFQIGSNYKIQALDGSTSIFNITAAKTIFNNDVQLTKKLNVKGETTLDNTLTTIGRSYLNGGITVHTKVSPELISSDKFTVDENGDTNTRGKLIASGLASLNGGINVNSRKFEVLKDTGNTSIAGTLGVTGKTTLNDTSVTTLTASGAVTLNSTLTVVGNTSLTTLVTSGLSSLNGGIAVKAENVDKFTVSSGTGNTNIAGTLGVTGDTILGNTSFSDQKVLRIKKGQITITDKGVEAGEYTATNMVDFILNVIHGELTFSGEFNAGETGEPSAANSYDYTTYED